MASLFKKNPMEAIGGTMAGVDPVFNPSECMTILYETKPEIIKEILPPPLTPYEKPYVILYYMNFGNTNLELGGYESTAVVIPSYFQGTRGNFVLSQICDSDMCTFLGREKYGYPKKVGECHHRYEFDRYVGYSARHGVPFCIMDADLTQEPNDPDFLKELFAAGTNDPDHPDMNVNWTYMFEFGRHGDVFLDTPRLVKGWKRNHGNHLDPRVGSAKVTLIPSVDDPWHELEVVRVLGAIVENTNLHMKCDNPEGMCEYFEVDPEAYLPYAFYGYDRSFTFNDF